MKSQAFTRASIDRCLSQTSVSGWRAACVETTPIWSDDPSITTANLRWYAPPSVSTKTGICLITISGGGYEGLSDGWLCEEFASFFTKHGVTCVDLEYRFRRDSAPYYGMSLKDARRAVRIVRSQAAARGFSPDKIGTISHSAGSHLALLLATGSQVADWPGCFGRTDAVEAFEDCGDELDKTVSPKTNYAITGAIAYALSDGDGKHNANRGYGAVLNSYIKFDSADPPAPLCLMHGCDDPWASPLASTQVFRKLKDMDVPAELHLYADRGHNFYGGCANPIPGCTHTAHDVYFERGLEFMRKIGLFGPLAAEESLVGRFPDDSARGVHLKEILWDGRSVPGAQTGRCTSCIEWHIPSKLNTAAVQLICSGGEEVETVTALRRCMNAKGMAVVTLQCRTAPAAALQDLQRAVRLVRSKAATYGLNPNAIGTMGFGACGALVYSQAVKPGADLYDHADAVDALSGDVQWAYPVSMSDGSASGIMSAAEFSFASTNGIPPIMFLLGSDDVAAAMNSVKAWEELRRVGVQSELHSIACSKKGFWKAGAPDTADVSWVERVFEFFHHENKMMQRAHFPDICPKILTPELVQKYRPPHVK